MEIEVTDSSPDPEPDQTSIYLQMSSINLRAEEESWITAYFWNREHIGKARISRIKWSSSDPSIVKIAKDETTGDRGKVTGVAVGEATVTAEATIVTASRTFTKETSLTVKVEGEPAMPELTIAPSVHIVTQSAIDNVDGSWQYDGIGKVAFVFSPDKSSATSADNITFYTFSIDTIVVGSHPRSGTVLPPQKSKQ